MTKFEAILLFNELHHEALENSDDKVALRTYWNDFTDSLMKDGRITEHQFENWENPF